MEGAYNPHWLSNKYKLEKKNSEKKKNLNCQSKTCSTPLISSKDRASVYNPVYNPTYNTNSENH